MCLSLSQSITLLIITIGLSHLLPAISYSYCKLTQQCYCNTNCSVPFQMYQCIITAKTIIYFIIIINLLSFAGYIPEGQHLYLNQSHSPVLDTLREYTSVLPLPSDHRMHTFTEVMLFSC